MAHCPIGKISNGMADTNWTELCATLPSEKTGLAALQLAVWLHLSQSTPARATVTCSNKSQAWGAYLCHSQEAHWRGQHTVFHISVRSNSEVRAALSTCVFGVCSYLPVKKSREQLSAIHREGKGMGDRQQASLAQSTSAEAGPR